MDRDLKVSNEFIESIALTAKSKHMPLLFKPYKNKVKLFFQHKQLHDFKVINASIYKNDNKFFTEGMYKAVYKYQYKDTKYLIKRI